MYVRNLLNPGEYFIPVPLGVPITARYNEKGKLEKIYIGYDEDSPDYTDMLLSVIKKSNLILPAISINGGTTWISGVLYTSKISSGEGELPGAIIEPMIQFLISDPSNFKFYAGTVRSTATSFYGSAPIRQWLQMNGFNVLPGFFLPAKLTRQTFIETVNVSQFKDNFEFPLIMYYIVFRRFRGTAVEFHSTHLSQYTCTTLHRLSPKCVKSSGQITGSISTGSDELSFDYNILQQFGIRKGVVFIVDHTGRIIHSRNANNTTCAILDNLICPVCGKKLSNSLDPTICDDIHCMSRQYYVVKHFLNQLHLPELEYSRYQELLTSAELQDILDILDISPYNSFDISVSLGTLLRAIIPLSDVSDDDILTSFVNRCNNSKESILYYITHPECIDTDLNISAANKGLTHWLSDAENKQHILNLLDHEHVNIVFSDKKFEGPQIFRDKNIYVTGKFKHGDLKDISAIFASYGAYVSDDNVNGADCVVVGDVLEDVNGQNIRAAQRSRIPVYTESEFFKRYQIDEDLSNNLVS